MARLPLPTSPSVSIALLLPHHPQPSLIFTSHSRWPLPPNGTTPQRPLRISVLDSSFNPPHAAHLALARHSSADALLLCFTAANPDKGTVESSVTTTRLEMIRAVALDLQRRAGQDGALELGANVAVALLDAPTFVQKSRVLKRELTELVREQTGGEEVEVKLDFLVGWDTLIRIFAPRYYQPPNPDLTTSMNAFLRDDGSSVSCARRGDVSPEEEHAFLESDEVKPWGSQVRLFDLEAEAVKGISSTEIRRAVKEQRWQDVRRDVPFEGVVEIVRREGLYRE
ncbi:hypothetical protein JCM10207_009057 [Rhodosporidiobolus poonsookiae]